MESVVINVEFWRGRRIFLTGHTGFKGAWMVLLLRSLGAEVFGLALPPDDDFGVFVQARVEGDVNHRIGDIRDLSVLQSAILESRPDIVIHMAAQSLVRRSYDEPVATFSTNVMGTVNLLEAVRKCPSIQAAIIVTSDKCYENTGSSVGYSEGDPMGGHDPYSSSKGCAELLTAAYRRSFFMHQGAAGIATARAGNVIGGGDWARDRLVPDLVRAFRSGDAVRIRNPASVRPWQHVLDPIIGYLVLAEHLVSDRRRFSEGWNFGPHQDSAVPVSVLVERLGMKWNGSDRWVTEAGNHPHEASYLGLDSSKAQSRLGWRPLIGLDQALQLCADWYQAFDKGLNMRELTQSQIGDIVDPIRR